MQFMDMLISVLHLTLFTSYLIVLSLKTSTIPILILQTCYRNTVKAIIDTQSAQYTPLQKEFEDVVEQLPGTTIDIIHIIIVIVTTANFVIVVMTMISVSFWKLS